MVTAHCRSEHVQATVTTSSTRQHSIERCSVISHLRRNLPAVDPDLHCDSLTLEANLEAQITDIPSEKLCDRNYRRSASWESFVAVSEWKKLNGNNLDGSKTTDEDILTNALSFFERQAPAKTRTCSTISRSSRRRASYNCSFEPNGCFDQQTLVFNHFNDHAQKKDTAKSPPLSPSQKAMTEWRRKKSLLAWDADSDARVLALVDSTGENFRSTALGLAIPSLNDTEITCKRTQSSAFKYDFAYGKKMLKSLEFDALMFSPDTSVDLCVEIFMELDLDKRLNISRYSIRSFVVNVRDRMLSNPYHNWFHVFDVTQTVYCLAMESGLMRIWSDKERLALLLAALCHDMEHPGVSNRFLLESRSALASLYGMDAACLEKHHSFRAFELMSNTLENGILASLSQEDRAEVMSMVEGLILATDMNRHTDYVAALAAAFPVLRSAFTPSSPDTNTEPAGAEVSADECGRREGEEAAGGAVVGVHNETRDGAELALDRLTDAQRRLLAQALVKCADTSNVIKPFSVAKKWAIKVTDEFFQQGDLERERGMAVSRGCDRHKDSRVGIQRGFIDFIRPLYSSLSLLLPRLHLVRRLDRTRAAWDRYLDDQALLAEVAAEVNAADANAGWDAYSLDQALAADFALDAASSDGMASVSSAVVS